MCIQNFITISPEQRLLYEKRRLQKDIWKNTDAEEIEVYYEALWSILQTMKHL